MNYTMEELAPIVGKLAAAYTSHESTSLSYEKAEQLMGAVLYCIRELEQAGSRSVISSEKMPALRAYEAGRACVEEKVKTALRLYNELLPEFSHYESRCLYDAFVRGVPEFFKWYDIRFAPQDTILTLDYPVLKDLSGYTGIDNVYEWIRCIGWEQRFLRLFPDSFVLRILSKYKKHGGEMAENLCEAVFPFILGHILAGKPLDAVDFAEADYLRIQEIFAQGDISDINGQLSRAVERLLKNHCTNSGEISEYVSCAVRAAVVRLKQAAEQGLLCQML